VRLTIREAINLTDVDDKTIAGAQAEGVELPDYTEPWIRAFSRGHRTARHRDAGGDAAPTDKANLQANGELIAALGRNGHTYARDGSTYFKISTLPDYGKLARLDHEGMKSGVSVDVDEYSKDDVRDFVLWKATRPGEPTWDVGAGPGRPGWHLECSAMALRLLGEPPIDVHAGGIDLLFPASRERDRAERGRDADVVLAVLGARRAPLRREREDVEVARQRVHAADVLARGHRASALRYLLLSSHYRKQLNFTWAGMEQAEESLRRIGDCLARLETVSRDALAGRSRRRRQGSNRIPRRAARRPEHGGRSPRPSSISCATSTPRSTRRTSDAPTPTRCAVTIDEFDCVLGVVTLRRAEDAQPPVPVDEIERLIEERKAARTRRDFARPTAYAMHSPSAASFSRTTLEAHAGNESDTARPERAKRVEGSGYPHRAAGSEGARHHRARPRPRLDLLHARLPAGHRERPRRRGRGRRRQRLPRLHRRDRGRLHRPLASEVVKAITDQAQKFLHMSGTDFYYELQAQLGEQIADIVPMAGPHRSFFSNSGTEANEAALKLAKFATGRHNVIAFFGAFHGGRWGRCR